MMTGALMLTADQVRHHRGVDHAQPVDPEYAQLAVDHRRVVALEDRRDATSPRTLSTWECRGPNLFHQADRDLRGPAGRQLHRRAETELIIVDVLYLAADDPDDPRQ